MSKNAPPLSDHLQQQPVVWQACLAKLSEFVAEKQIKNWLASLHVEEAIDGSSLKIYAPNHFKMEYIRSQYGALLSKAILLVNEAPISLIFTTGKPGSSAKKAPAAQQAPTRVEEKAPPSTALSLAPPALSAEDSATVAKRSDKSKNKSHLNPALTFDTLVEGRANRMAFHTGQTICLDSYKGEFNPYFLYGASGLGKTHLMHAIGHEYLRQHPKANVLYIHADKFVNDVVKACQTKSFTAFNERYHTLDLLMIDDVQQFSGKEKTLEEFFNAFEALLSKRAQIILTSDTYPKELNQMPDRLITRFVSGITVGLEPPEIEMRVAILHRKAESSGHKLPQDVAWFIAHAVVSNVRELEGALRNVMAYARFKNLPLDIHTTKEALKDLISAQNRQINIENIQKTVADFYRISIADMHSKRRKANIVKARHIAMFLAKELTQKSLPALGADFGRDHTTVLHAVKKISKDRLEDTQLDQEINILEQSLRS